MTKVASNHGPRKTRWRAYTELLARGEATPNVHIGIAASFTANTLVPFVGASLLEIGLSPSIQLGPYNQLFQVCLEHAVYFQGQVDIVALLFRLEDIAFEEIYRYCSGDAAALQAVCGKVDHLVSAVRKLRSVFPGTIVISVPPLPSGIPVPSVTFAEQNLGHLHRAVCEHFLREIQGIAALRVCDLDAVQREVGQAAAFDARQWYLYRQPFSDAFLSHAGAVLARLVAALKTPPKKCLVLDCDNTLWGGVIGEDGLGGIQLGNEFPGSAYRDFQRLLLAWRAQGVLLALASKNNKADVWEVFDRHGEMLLKREHIVAAEIGWDPKSAAIPKLAKALNIGSDSFVFIDDNPVEIAQMQQACPEVASILLPEEPAYIVETLKALPYFDRLEITEEDRQRSDMMRAEVLRASTGSALSQEDFARSLELRLDFFRAQAADLDRITQLINKTNQFNLTTIRRTSDEVRALMESAAHRVYGLRIADKYGEYGLTGVVIAGIQRERGRFDIDTLLLSCRVLGRGVETALLAALADEARGEGLVEIGASFRPSEKNAPAASYLPKHGFEPDGDARWKLAVEKIPAVQPWVNLSRSS